MALPDFDEDSRRNNMISDESSRSSSRSSSSNSGSSGRSSSSNSKSSSSSSGSSSSSSTSSSRGSSSGRSSSRGSNMQQQPKQQQLSGQQQQQLSGQQPQQLSGQQQQQLSGQQQQQLSGQQPQQQRKQQEEEEYIDQGSITLLVDGINYPITSGNFIDLCLKGYYDNERVSYQTYEDFGLPFSDSDSDSSRSSSSGSSSVNRNITIIGNTIKEYIDPLTMKSRRIPLEIFREDKNRYRFTALGAAKNSVVYTKANPLQSFATYGAIGMYHPRMNLNGGSSAFFWCPMNHTSSITMNNMNELPYIKRLNNKYSLFAYVIEGM